MFKRMVAAALLTTVTLTTPVTAFAGSFSGGHSSAASSHSSSGTRSYSGQSSSGTYHSGYSSPSKASGGTYSSSGTYHSGYTSPSSHVGGYSSTYGHSASGSKVGSFTTHAAAFGAGALLGSMFHPFGLGGHHIYGGGFPILAILGFIIDLLIVALIVWLVYRVLRTSGNRRGGWERNDR